MHYSRAARLPASSRLILPLPILAGMLVIAVGIVSAGLIMQSRSGNDTSESPAGIGVEEGPVRPAVSNSQVYDNALQKKTIQELRSFGNWLEVNNAKGFVGELGWPQSTDSTGWNQVADRWFKEAQSYDLWATAWAAGSWWGNYPMTMYGHTQGQQDLDAVFPQAEVLEKHSANALGDRRGVNVAGMEFGETVSALKPGVPGQDYFYEPESSFAFLQSRGIKTVRLPFRWERIQPVLSGPLKDAEIVAIRTILDAAKESDIKVILDLHNYGAYKTGQRTALLGDGTLTEGHLADVWLKLSETFKSHGAVLGYGIMNEPHDLPAGRYASPAKSWEAISGKVVQRLRESGDKKVVLVAGYDWSSLARWQQNHPKAWISDPAHNVRYEAHHYWDSDGSGTYPLSFQEEVSNAQ